MPKLDLFYCLCYAVLMSRETLYSKGVEGADALKEKALLVFDLISRTLYRSRFSPGDKNDG